MTWRCAVLAGVLAAATPAAPAPATTPAATPAATRDATPSTATPAGTSAGPTVGTIARRTTLLVHDLEASIAFYELIGFERWYEGRGGTVSGEGLPVDGVRTGDPTRLVILKGRDPYVGMVGLLQYGPKRPLPPPGRLQVGDAILMIETAGLDSIATKLRAAGHRIHQGPKTSRIRSVAAEWDAKFLMVFDPDGRMVELTERLN